MKKLLVSYSNCQGGGMLHFLKKTRLAETWDFVQWNNWQCMLDEQDPAGMVRDIRKADLFVYQPTCAFTSRAGVPVDSTEDLVQMVPKGCQTLSYAYQFNNGFWPVMKHGSTWFAGDQVASLIRHQDNRRLFGAYNAGDIYFDCAKRFLECLAEQNNRESVCDLRATSFILKYYRKRRLFLIENHPTSFLLGYLAALVVRKIDEPGHEQAIEDMRTQNENEVNLPCGCFPTHPAAVSELGLDYAPDDHAHEFYRAKLEEMVKDAAALRQN
jgi:Polysaccharide biosynthesis enzyme WcbI